MSSLATPLASAAARPRVAPPPSRASRRNVRAEAHGDVFGSRASRCAGAHRRDVSARVGLSDPGYWEGVTALMTPTVAVDLSPPSLAALAIGGVLVLGHSWESIEASRGWRDGKRGGDASTRKENANASTTDSSAASLLATPNERERVHEIHEINTGTPVTQKIMTKAEREAAEARARAARVLAVAAPRARRRGDARRRRRRRRCAGELGPAAFRCEDRGVHEQRVREEGGEGGAERASPSGGGERNASSG